MEVRFLSSTGMFPVPKGGEREDGLTGGRRKAKAEKTTEMTQGRVEDKDLA